MRADNVLHLGVKELRSLARDPIMLALIVYSFTFAIYTASTALPETLNKASIAIVDEDRSPLSARISGALYPPYFLPPVTITHAEMDARMDAGLDTFALDIPPEFQRDLLAGKRPTIQLNVDATRMSQAFTGSGYVQSIVAGEVRAFGERYRAATTLPADLVLRARFNPGLDKSWFGAIVQVINQVTMLSIVLTGAALIREREHGTIEHLLVMPVTPFEIMCAKIWANGLAILLATALSLYAVVQAVLDVEVQGSVPLFLAGSALYLFSVTALGIFLATLAGSMPQFGLLSIPVFIVMNLLSGAMTPLESMPAWLQMAMQASPSTHFVKLAQSILFRGAGIDLIWRHLAPIAGIGAVLFTVAWMRFRRAIAQP